MRASLPAVRKWTPAPDQSRRRAAGLGHHPPGSAGVLEERLQGVHLPFQVPVSPLRLAVPQPGPMPVRPARAHTARCGEAVPQEMMRRLVAGEPPIRLWRGHRGLTRTELAEQAQVDKTYLSQLESGRKVGSVAVLRRPATTLSVDLDDLVADASTDTTALDGW